jgi:hypothetical protein
MDGNDVGEKLTFLEQVWSLDSVSGDLAAKAKYVFAENKMLFQRIT